jgi:solute carrier family 39 (zinc transporter), member 1/2/3
MFPPAMEALTNPCLPSPFGTTFNAWAGLFALISALFVQFIQTVAINHFTQPEDSTEDYHSHDVAAGILDKQNSMIRVPSVSASEAQEEQHDHTPFKLAGDIKHVHSEGCSHEHHHHHEHRTEKNIPSATDDLEQNIAFPTDKRAATVPVTETTPKNSTLELGALSVATNIHSDGCCAVNHVILSQDHHHLQITAYILEAGIAIHSMVIGVAIGVSGGSEFISLLVAVAFHQFFEGFALATTGNF